MLYIHESNILNKIETNYLNKNKVRIGNIIKNYYENVYLKMRKEIETLIFDDEHLDSFDKATNIFNTYYSTCIKFRDDNGIKSQSKFDSTFLEEISTYLFKDLPEIKNGNLGIFNKKIYAGLKINNDKKIEVIPKDCDFCIGKKVKISIDGQSPVDLIIPVVAVEVKTYLDATMFGEVKSSSRSIRSASPNSKTYVLMGYKCIADEHLIAARQDSVLTEIFILRKNENSPIDRDTIYSYWKEISETVKNISGDEKIEAPGRVLRP